VKLPNGENAVVELEKFTEYCLNPDHPSGRHKAHVFESLLGLTLKNADFLRDKVREAAMSYEAEIELPTKYGERYVIDFELKTDKGTATIRSTWIIRREEGFPRLTSCYVK